MDLHVTIPIRRADRGQSDGPVSDMSDPLSTLPDWQLARLMILRDALGDPPMSCPEEASLEWLAGQQLTTVQSVAAVIRRARALATLGVTTDGRTVDHS